jgi:hypothetical protein
MYFAARDLFGTAQRAEVRSLALRSRQILTLTRMARKHARVNCTPFGARILDFRDQQAGPLEATEPHQCLSGPVIAQPLPQGVSQLPPNARVHLSERVLASPQQGPVPCQLDNLGPGFGVTPQWW